MNRIIGVLAVGLLTIWFAVAGVAAAKKVGGNPNVKHATEIATVLDGR